MASQSPMLHVPTKRTDDTDFTFAFRSYIQQVYQEDPDKYVQEIASLNRLRQDIRGAGKDLTGRDILYRYYGQLELLDLRFPIDEKHVKVVFSWYDAFSGTKVSQHSVAYEKACVIFNLAATCSSIAALQNRASSSIATDSSSTPSSPTGAAPMTPNVNGLKMAFNYFQGAAGLFQYINDNFLHPPSVDLGRDSIRCLSELMLAQAQECFLEKVLAEKKKGMLPAKLASQAATLYANVMDYVNATTLKAQIEKTWALLCQVKSKYFLAVANYHRGIACESESKYGEMVARLQLSEIYAKEANKLASSFASAYPNFTTSADAGAVAGAGEGAPPSSSGGLASSFWGSSSSSSSSATTASVALLDATRMLLTNVTDKKNLATKDNDLIYHDSVPNTDALAPVDKLLAVKPLAFAEICAGGAADIPRIVGPDIFAKLVPISVHESASMYSEEKAKLLRSEEEQVKDVDAELSVSLESMDLVRTLDKLRRMAKSAHLDEYGSLPSEIRNWCQDIGGSESGRAGDSMDELLTVLDGLKSRARETLTSVGVTLDEEARECESMRLKFADWPQEPSLRLTTGIRNEVKRHRETLEQAAETDRQLVQRIQELKPDLATLKRPYEEVEAISVQVVSTGDPKQGASVPVANLIEEDVKSDAGLGALGEQLLIEKMDNLLARIRQLKKERQETFEEFRTKLLNDDISNLLILNKNKEAALFQSELAKFKPLTQKLSSNIETHRALMQELVNEYENLKERSYGMKLVESREKRKQALLARWRKAYESWRECRDGLQKGIQFYSGLTDMVERTAAEAKAFVRARAEERNQLASTMQAQAAEKGQKQLKEQLERLRLGTSSLDSPASSSPAPGMNGYGGGAPTLPQPSRLPPSSAPPPVPPAPYASSAYAASAPAPYSPTPASPLQSFAPPMPAVPQPGPPPPRPVPPPSAYFQQPQPVAPPVPPTQPYGAPPRPAAPQQPYMSSPPQSQAPGPMPPQMQTPQLASYSQSAPPAGSPYPGSPYQGQPTGPPPAQGGPPASYGGGQASFPTQMPYPQTQPPSQQSVPQQYAPSVPQSGPPPPQPSGVPYQGQSAGPPIGHPMSPQQTAPYQTYQQQQPPTAYNRPPAPSAAPPPGPWQQPAPAMNYYANQAPYGNAFRPGPEQAPPPPVPSKPGGLGGPPPPLPPGAQPVPAPGSYLAPQAYYGATQRPPNAPGYAQQQPYPQQQPHPPAGTGQFGGYQSPGAGGHAPYAQPPPAQATYGQPQGPNQQPAQPYGAPPPPAQPYGAPPPSAQPYAQGPPGPGQPAQGQAPPAGQPYGQQSVQPQANYGPPAPSYPSNPPYGSQAPPTQYGQPYPPQQPPPAPQGAYGGGYGSPQSSVPQAPQAWNGYQQQQPVQQWGPQPQQQQQQPPPGYGQPIQPQRSGLMD
ncbi:BRO1-like domain-containing protein [Hyaloraphidium curvatum]|nr:BRO1-like domain-containing protein [Hyaloraphidium curvatum]